MLLKDVFDFSLEEAADSLSTTVGAIKAALHRARGKLVETPSEEAAVPRPAVLDAFCAAFNAGDLDGLMALYEPDAIVIPQLGAEPVKGTSAIRSALEGFLALKGKVELETKHVVQHGDIALLRSAWRLKGTGPDGKTVEMAHGSAEVVRRQRDGSWRYVIDHPFGSD